MITPAARTLRVLTYNVRSLRDDRAALVAVIRGCVPDVACIQEAPRRLRWRAACAALARDAGLRYVAGGRTAGDCLLLCRADLEPAQPRAVLLSTQRGLHQRGVALASFDGSTVASVHLGLDATQRRTHVAEVLALLGPRQPAVLAGDVNEPPGQPAWAAITAVLTDAGAGSGPTFPARAPGRRIDAVFAGSGLAVVSYDVVDSPQVRRASDHRPVLAVLRRPEGALLSTLVPQHL